MWNLRISTSPELENYIDAGQAEKLRSDIELIEGVYPEFDVDTYLKGDSCSRAFWFCLE